MRDRDIECEWKEKHQEGAFRVAGYRALIPLRNQPCYFEVYELIHKAYGLGYTDATSDLTPPPDEQHD